MGRMINADIKEKIRNWEIAVIASFLCRYRIWFRQSL